jgi:plastocyanin
VSTRIAITSVAIRKGVLALLLPSCVVVACGGPNSTSNPKPHATPTASAPPPCPYAPPGGALPSPLPSLGESLSLSTAPCFARYEGVADVRGLANFNLTIGHVRPGVPYFAPTVVKGTAGESLHLHVVNTTDTLHNISIPSEGIDADVRAGGTADVVVTFPTRGPISYFCSYHQDEDQAGELITISP